MTTDSGTSVHIFKKSQLCFEVNLRSPAISFVCFNMISTPSVQCTARMGGDCSG